MNKNYIKYLQNIDNGAYNAIIELFKSKGVTELDISNKDDEYDDVHAYCYNDDCNSADNIKLEKIVFHDGRLTFIDESGEKHSMQDFHDGTMPYIHSMVMWLTSDMPDVKRTRKYDVYLYYHGCYSTTVEAENKDEALDLAKHEVEKLSELEFLDAIELQSNGNDVSEEN